MKAADEVIIPYLVSFFSRFIVDCFNEAVFFHLPLLGVLGVWLLAAFLVYSEREEDDPERPARDDQLRHGGHRRQLPVRLRQAARQVEGVKYFFERFSVLFYFHACLSVLLQMAYCAVYETSRSFHNIDPRTFGI